MNTEEELQKALNSLKFSETLNLLRLLAICYNDKTKYYPLPTGTKNWRVILQPPMSVSDYQKMSSYAEFKTKTLPLIDFFGTSIAYCQENDTLAYCLPPRKPEIKMDYNKDGTEFMKSIRRLNKSFDSFKKPYVPTCFICDEQILEDEYFTGIMNPGKITVLMHVNCATKRGLDVCKECMNVIDMTDPYNVNRVCENCREDEK